MVSPSIFISCTSATPAAGVEMLTSFVPVGAVSFMKAPVPLWPGTDWRTQPSRTSTVATPCATTSSFAAGLLSPAVELPDAGTSAQSTLPTSQVCSTLNHSGPGVPGTLPRSTNSARSLPGSASCGVSAIQRTSPSPLPFCTSSFQPLRACASLSTKPLGRRTARPVVALAPSQAWPTRKAAL
jgi:hypothetical protein